MAKLFLTPEDVRQAGWSLVISGTISAHDTLWGVPRGGVPVALMLAGMTGAKLAASAEEATKIVDDIYDSGRTAARFAEKPFLVLFDKRLPQWSGQWLVLPWENSSDLGDTSAEDSVVRLLQFIGEDPNREGLRETPKRVMRAWKEWASGYDVDPASVLKTFEDGAERYDEMIVVHNIPVVSKCEHHMADITGSAHVGYVPDGRILGLSKLPRLVEVFARRLQVQERLTAQIADALQEHLRPKGIGVLIRAAHACMSGRGVRIHGSLTTTSAMRGAFLDKPEARAEFLALCRDAESIR